MNRLLFLSLCLLLSVTGFAQSKKEKQVANAVSHLIKAMEDGNIIDLSRIASDKLSYGHSGGKVENKQEFVNTFATGASDFVKINISEQTISITKKIAIVRHLFDADTNDNNKPGHVTLKILTVWQKTGGQWKLLARQAVKPPVK
ncbi:MAG: nuclear transport factor 2 family protein [Niabella sp.]